MTTTDSLADPAREFSVMPFWFWNDDLDKAEILRQIDDFERHGVYGFVIHPRVGLPRDLGWMSERLLRFYRIAITEARKRGMQVILTDEGAYPSGSSSGQVVAENPAFAARGLAPRLLEGDAEPVLERGERLLAVVSRVDGQRLAVVDRPAGSVVRGLHYVGGGPKEDLPPAADLLNPAAVTAYLRLVHERFHAAFGEDFGGTVRALFTDEPSPLSKRRGAKDLMPGSVAAMRHVHRTLGYDFTPHLPALWYDDEPDALRHRAAYLRAVELRLQRTYYAQLSRWCVSHRVALMGHPYRPDDLGALRYFQVPGQDAVWRRILPDHPSALEGPESTQAKCSASAMVHGGRRRNANECFGAYGHELSWDEMLWLSMWAFVRGVNQLVPHAFFYSTRGARLDERPRDVGPNSPWWDDYPRYALACRRLGWINTDSRAQCDVAILGIGGTLPWQAAKACFQNQIDFCYVDEEDLLERAVVGSAQIDLGGGRYRVLVVEGEVSPALLQVLGDFVPNVATFDAAQPQSFAEELARRIDPQGERSWVTRGSAPGLRVRQVVKGATKIAMLFNETQPSIDAPLVPAGPGAAADLMSFDVFTGDRSLWPARQRRLRLGGHQMAIALSSVAPPVDLPFARRVRWDSDFELPAALPLLVVIGCDTHGVDAALALASAMDAHSPGLALLVHVVNPGSADVARVHAHRTALQQTHLALSSERTQLANLGSSRRRGYLAVAGLLRVAELLPVVDTPVLCVGQGVRMVAPLGDTFAERAPAETIFAIAAARFADGGSNFWVRPTPDAVDLLAHLARDLAGAVSDDAVGPGFAAKVLDTRLAAAPPGLVGRLDPRYADSSASSEAILVQPAPPPPPPIEENPGWPALDPDAVPPPPSAPMQPATPTESSALAAVPQLSARRRILAHFNALFLFIVVIPTALAVLYFGLFASDVYISESRFVVRSPQHGASSGIGALLQGTVLSRSQDDTYTVHDFIESRDALHQLQDKLDIRKAFSNHDISVFNRFPGLSPNDSFENFFQYYTGHVQVDYDTVSSITTLTVRAFSANDARRINEMLLQMGENLVNNVNQRSRQDLIGVALSEVRQAQEKSIAANSAMSRFRIGKALFDPVKQGDLQLDAVAKMQDDLRTGEAQLARLIQLSPRNPQIPALRAQVEQLRQSIASESSKLTGRDRSLTTNTPEYERLFLEKDFADKQLSSTLATLDSARSEAARKQLYLERLVEPNLPDMAMEPRRLRSMLMVLAVALAVWGVASLLVSSIREHTD